MFNNPKKIKNYLELIPKRNVETFTEHEEKITLLIPKFKHEGIRKWLIPHHKSSHIKIHLDETGSKVWRLINNQKTVGEICIQLKDNFDIQGVRMELLEERITKFLTMLYKSRFIRFENLD